MHTSPIHAVQPLLIHVYMLFFPWDLSHTEVQGFTEFCGAFLKNYLGYFVSPIRLTGSAIESLFAQYKYTTGGKLDAANYSIARAAFLTEQAISNHHSGKGYTTPDTTSSSWKEKVWKERGTNIVYFLNWVIRGYSLNFVQIDAFLCYLCESKNLYYIAFLWTRIHYLCIIKVRE